ncbi:MAG TPA: hypothetical protein ENN80_02275, partial [Candidatus Hydrogenedentes bacterium]|nr:hypothetical protein [Candidatus Hydrogenedentota bacterium]
HGALVAAVGQAAQEPHLAGGRHLRELPGNGRCRLGQVRLLSALADRGDKGAMDAVVRCVKRGDEAVQAAALEALAKLGDASTVPLLAEYATADKRSLQRAARGSLYTLRGEDIDRTILKAVREGAKDVRAELIAATVERNMMDAVPVLLECANDSAEEISAAALKALAELGGPDDMPALVACTVGAANDAQRAQAAKAVVAIGRKAAAAEGSASAVLAALEKAPGTPVRCALLGIVGELGDPNGLDVLRTAAQDRDKAVQDAAVRALSGWPTTAVLDDLFAIAKGSANQTHRVLALRNYVRLLALPSDRPAGETVAKYREAMALAPRTEEKRAVLAALANVHHPGALELAVPYLDNPDLQAEALAASLKVAEAICGAYPEEAGAAATKIAALAKDDETKQKAQAVLKTIEQLKGFITAWQVSPPYTQENKGGSELFDVVFPPEAGAADVAWQVMPVNLVPEKPWMMALDAFLGGENRVAYLRTTLVSPKAQQARLEMGSDDGLKVWLNGQVVSANSAARGCNPGDDKVDVQLKQGENPLLLKVTQGGGQWAAAVRLVAPDGGLLEGVKATLE